MPLMNALAGASGGPVADGVISAHLPPQREGARALVSSLPARPIVSHNAPHQSGSHQTPAPNPEDATGEGMQRTHRHAVGTRLGNHRTRPRFFNRTHEERKGNLHSKVT